MKRRPRDRGQRVVKQMQPIPVLLWCSAILALSGCVIPLGTKITAGQKYSRESVAFLDLPNTTREEVIATLGPAAYEFQEMRTLVYVWVRARKYEVVPLELDTDMHPVFNVGKAYQTTDDAIRWGLFIAFDAHGVVSAHTVRGLDKTSAEEACLRWNSVRAARSLHSTPQW